MGSWDAFPVLVRHFFLLFPPRNDMEIPQAIKTALQYETKVHGLYLDAQKRAKDPAAKRAFDLLAEEERRHNLLSEEPPR
ncbi:MAG: hypothetical protein AB1726_06135 [Planctomycetota bacterium]